ncbi:uncharacterized protein PAC_17010 [Phialocephala subalpina]|uniref:J domain-containing protein n=1 Tax=Phialocephala subalpina TaxID=576137 RepID=A0A1L7XPY9_9HELO|nr:uncharacterized protein PAC_17010 [Phialocephala subalpina]
MRSAKFTDLYAVLEVPRNCDAEQIKVAYKKLALARHPDKNLDNPNATAQFQALVDAFEILSDKSKRSTYNLEWDRRNAQKTAYSSFQNSSSKPSPFQPHTSGPSSSNSSSYNTSEYPYYEYYANFYFYEPYTSWSPQNPPTPSDDNDYASAKYAAWAGEKRTQHGKEYVWGYYSGKWQWKLLSAGWEWVWKESTNQWMPTVPQAPHYDRPCGRPQAQAQAESQPPSRPKTLLRPDAASFNPQAQLAKSANGFTPGMRKAGGFFQ